MCSQCVYNRESRRYSLELRVVRFLASECHITTELADGRTETDAGYGSQVPRIMGEHREAVMRRRKATLGHEDVELQLCSC